MKEIRFRAWDNVGKKMRGVWLIKFNGTPIVINDGSNIKDRDITLLQYTGLKDWKGVSDVYEGDIIKADILVNTWDKGKLCTVERKDMIGLVEVYFSKFIVDFQSSTKAPDWLSKDEYDLNRLLIGCFKYEVIGNIYENGSLLTKE